MSPIRESRRRRSRRPRQAGRRGRTTERCLEGWEETIIDTRRQGERLNEALIGQGIDVALLNSAGSVCYASGFETFLPIDSGTEFAGGPTLAVVSSRGMPSRLLVADAHAVKARMQNRLPEIEIFPSFGHFDPVDEVEAFLSAVRKALHDLGAKSGRRVAIEYRWLPASVYRLLEDEFAGVELVDAGPALLEARSIKTSEEVERLRRAAGVADAGQEVLRERSRHGRNELDLWGEVTARMECVAGRELPLVGELVTGARTGIVSYPAGPINRTLERGDTALMDISPRVDGYWADCCNSFVVDAEPTAEQLRYYRASRDAFDAAFEALRPGNRACDVEARAREALARHGFDVAHYAGHQVGVTVNEAPRLVGYDTTEIRSGMVFAVEPGVYGGQETATGSRSEKMVLVTDGDPELLSAFTWGMDE